MVSLQIPDTVLKSIKYTDEGRPGGNLGHSFPSFDPPSLTPDVNVVSEATSYPSRPLLVYRFSHRSFLVVDFRVDLTGTRFTHVDYPLLYRGL